MKVIESASLAFRAGNSDKVYHVSLEQNGAGYLVSAQYGRRGGTLATDNKTKSGSVPFDTAKQIFDRVLREKLGKGYLATASSSDGERDTGAPAPAPQIQPQSNPVNPVNPVHSQELLEEIPDEATMLRFLADDRYWMQDKSDGHSRGVVKTDGSIFGLNKTGGRVPLPAEIVAELERIPLKTFQLDAELVGDKLVCRDLLNADRDIAALSYADRFGLLVSFIPHPSSFILCVETWEGAQNKAAALALAREERREGVVFKLKTAPHRPGRNGQHKKFKFCKTLSAIAGKPRATGKDSVELFLYDTASPASDLIRCGTVSLIGKPPVREGDIVEVRYLYAYPSKLVVQGRLLRVRDDVRASECTTAQLIYKREE